MIIRYYQKAYSVQFFIYTFAALIIWADAFAFPSPAVSFTSNTPVYSGIITGLHALPELIQVIIAFFLLLAEAVLINAMLIQHKFVTRLTFLPAMVYIVLMSYYPTMLTVTPVLIANLFLILSMNVTLGIYLKPEPYREIFNATFLISVASVFYLPALIFFVFFWLALFTYRISSLREWFITLSGLVAPYIFIVFYYFWFDKIEHFIEDFLLFFARIQPFRFEFSDPVQMDVYLGLVVILFILAVISFIKTAYETGEKVIAMRKKMTVVLNAIIIAAMTFIFGLSDPVIHSTIMMVPLTSISIYFFTGTKRLRFAEALFSVLLVLIVVSKLVFRVPPTF
jgi:hypothetical protein